MTNLTGESQEVVIVVGVRYDLYEVVVIIHVFIDVEEDLLSTHDVGQLLLHHSAEDYHIRNQAFLMQKASVPQSSQICKKKIGCTRVISFCTIFFLLCKLILI